MPRNGALYYVKETYETTRSLFSSTPINLNCRLLNYAQHFSKGNSFAEKGPEISEATQAKDMHTFLRSFNTFTHISGTLLLQKLAAV